MVYTWRKNINDMDPKVKKDLDSIKHGLSLALTKETANFFFQLSRENHLMNISAWTKGPQDANYKYSEKTPEKCRNSLMFLCTSRPQAVALEAEIRRSLISTFKKRAGTNQAFIDLGLYSESSKVRTLHRMLLYKGKCLVEFFEGVFDQYRVSFRGGNKRGANFSEVFLNLELRAAKEIIHGPRKEFFLSTDGGTSGLTPKM